MKPARIPFTLLLCLLLAGCAAQLAYRDGKALAQQDKTEASLQKFKEALAHDPGNTAYRQALLETRERAVYRLLEQADRAAAADGVAAAEPLYQRVLGLDPSNQRARAGLQNVEAEQRHARLLAEGRAALQRRDLADARARAGAVRTENPEHAGAQDLLRSIQQKAAPAPAQALAAAYRKPISIEFRDASLRQVFDVIARSAGLNFVFDKDVRLDQRTSVYLRNSNVEAALHYTLLTNQLELQVLDGNTVLVFPNTAAKLADYQEMVVRSFFLTSGDARVVANTLKTILKARDVVVDEKLNMLIMRDSPAAVRLAEKLVALHDMPEPEVMLEVEVLEVKRTRLLELGVQWPGSLALAPLPTAGGKVLTLADLRNLNSAGIGATVGAVNVRAHQDDGDTNLLANPRIRARNREKARVLIGDRVPNITTTSTASGFVSESVNYLEVGLKLEVEPTVHLDGDVAIRVNLEVSNVTNQVTTASGTTAYQIGTRNASTLLQLKDGETQVLAGLISDRDRRLGNKLPLFGEVPILGRLFGSQTSDNEKTEIVLAITPRLVRNIRRPEVDTAEFLSGTATTMRPRPDAVAVPAGMPAPPGAGSRALNGVASGAPAADRTMAANLQTPPPPVPAQAVVAPEPVVVAADSAQQTDAVRWIWQAPARVKVGDSFTVQLDMQSPLPVQSAPLTLSFDAGAFEVLQVSAGDFMRQGGAQSDFSSQVVPGGVRVNDVRADAVGASGSGAIVRLQLRALAPAPAARLQVSAAAPTGANGRALARYMPAPLVLQVEP